MTPYQASAAPGRAGEGSLAVKTEVLGVRPSRSGLRLDLTGSGGDCAQARNGDTRSGRLVGVSGVVDGLISASVAEDGSVSLQVRIGTGDVAGGPRDHVEIILDLEYANGLGALFNDGRRSVPVGAEGQWSPCCVGIRLHASTPAAG